MTTSSALLSFTGQKYFHLPLLYIPLVQPPLAFPQAAVPPLSRPPSQGCLPWPTPCPADWGARYSPAPTHVECRLLLYAIAEHPGRAVVAKHTVHTYSAQHGIHRPGQIITLHAVEVEAPVHTGEDGLHAGIEDQ